MRQLRSLWRDSSAVTAIAFGVSAFVVLGMVGLGTEAGSWYYGRRDAQDAADPAAYAGAVRLSFAQNGLVPPVSLTAAQAQAIGAATDTASRNGFTTGTLNTTVTVNTPPSSGPNAGNITAVEVIVARTRPRLISMLFIATNPVIQTRSVAALTANGPACMLALAGGGLSAGGNTTVNAPGCVLASNATGPSSINIFGSASISALSLTSVGGCSGCTQPFTEYAAPTPNPFAALDNKTLPTFNNSSCMSIPGVANNGTISVSPLNLTPPPAGKAICNLKVTSSGQVVNFAQGTYYFYNTSLDIQGGTVNGTGVTMVFTGSPNQIGSPNINANATVNLTAPTAAQASDPDYAGILFFRDPRATGGPNTQPDINGGANTVLTGAMYFPNATVKYNGNAAINQCSVLVARTITLTGDSGVNVSGCASLGFPNIVPVTQIVKLVE